MPLKNHWTLAEFNYLHREFTLHSAENHYLDPACHGDMAICRPVDQPGVSPKENAFAFEVNSAQFPISC